MNLLKSLAAVSSMTMISRVLGFVRDTIVARMFGAGMATDAFFVAFRLPNLLRRMFAEGAFSQAFVPILGEYRNRRGTDDTRTLIDHVATLLALVVAFVAIFFGANEGWKWATTSPTFSLRDVQVSGQAEATDVELVRLGGILLGQNLISMDVKSIERSIATHPWVKSVRVTRHLPSRLTIEVEEHRAVALLSLGKPDERFKLVAGGRNPDAADRHAGP